MSPPNSTIAYNRFLNCTQSITALLDGVIENLGSLTTNRFSSSSFSFRAACSFDQLVVVCKPGSFHGFLWGFTSLCLPSWTELSKNINLFLTVISINNSTQQPRNPAPLSFSNSESHLLKVLHNEAMSTHILC